MTITATVVSQPITASVAGGNAIAANVGSSTVTANASGGIGPQGPAGQAGSGGSVTDASLLTTGTLSAARLPASVVLTTDSRLSDARTPTAHSHAVSDVTGLQTALDGKQASGSYAAASHTHTAGQVSGLATVATSGSYADLTNKPTLFSGSYADLTNTPASFAPAAHNQAWSTITATPTTLSGYGIIDAVGSSDSRLSDSRTPASHVHGNITNAGAIGSTSGQIVVTTTSGVLTTAATIASSAVSGLAAVATSGSYADLSNKPSIPAATTSASDLTSGTLSQARLDFIPIHPFLLMGG